MSPLKTLHTAELSAPMPRDEERAYEFSSDLVTLVDGREAEAEAVRTIRTHIIARHLEDGRRALAVLAATEGTGCTFVTANLAVALAQTGVSTLLIDGNLRTPAVHKFIRPQGFVATGLRQCLEAGGPAEDYICADVLPNLSLMYSGGAAPDVQELLGSETFRDLIEGCLRDYDITIVDCPPAQKFADARRISTIVGYGLIVARQNVSLLTGISTVAERMREDGVQLVGTVLNEFRA